MPTRIGIGALGRRELTGTLVEIIGAVAVATAIVAALQDSAPATGLGAVYLLGVLEVAIRRGQWPALATAMLSVLTLNFFFVPPRHRLTIAHSQDVVELIVFLIVGVVVGRLAAIGRSRAREAESRARVASAREREATLLAQSASAILAGQNVRSALEDLGKRIAGAVGASRARVVLEAVPRPQPGELTFPLPSRSQNLWLYVNEDMAWAGDDLRRIADPLGKLIDVSVERERLAEREAEREAARLADTARTAVLHAISHDLRSPLTAITTAGAALQADTVTAQEREEMLEVIDTEAARLARMVDDLLDLSKIEAGAVNPQSDWCDVRDAVASAAAQLRTGHPIEFIFPDELPLVRADAAQLERVFSNLIENAIKFSPPGVPVRISAATGGGRLTVRIVDRGRGIPARYRARVFEPFFRGRDDRGPGSGLGLAICRGFVEANGGRIALQSAAGEGTSFAVTFPVADQPQAVA